MLRLHELERDTRLALKESESIHTFFILRRKHWYWPFTGNAHMFKNAVKCVLISVTLRISHSQPKPLLQFFISHLRCKRASNRVWQAAIFSFLYRLSLRERHKELRRPLSMNPAMSFLMFHKRHKGHIYLSAVIFQRFISLTSSVISYWQWQVVDSCFGLGPGRNVRNKASTLILCLFYLIFT